MAQNDAKSFAAQIDAEMDDCRAEFATEIVAIAGEALESLIAKTPVRTGEARGGWGVVIGEGSEGPTSLPARDRDGAATLAIGLAELLGYGKDGKLAIIRIGNDVDHIHILEHGGGTASPHAMVALTLAELMTKYSR